SSIAAEVWRDLAQSAEGDVSIAVPVDLRRILPEIPARYFGNALRPAVVRAPAADVREAPGADLARRIEAAIRGVDRASLTADFHLVEAIRRAGGLAAMRDQR